MVDELRVNIALSEVDFARECAAIAREFQAEKAMAEAKTAALSRRLVELQVEAARNTSESPHRAAALRKEGLNHVLECLQRERKRILSVLQIG